MERAIEMLFGVQFLIFGASHVLRPRDWVDFFVRLRGLGYAGVFLNGLLPLVGGSMIVSLHPVWSGPPLVLTLLGCCFLAKSATCLCFPAVHLKSLQRISLEKAWAFQVAGGVMFALGAFSLFLAFGRWTV